MQAGHGPAHAPINSRMKRVRFLEAAAERPGPSEAPSSSWPNTLAAFQIDEIKPITADACPPPRNHP